MSSVFNDDHSISEKKEWLAKYLPEIPEENQIFVPYGESKSDYILDKSSEDVLLDDFTKNLNEWHRKAVKIYNGINGTKGTWKGYSIHSNMVPDKLLLQFDAIVMI